MKQLKAVFLTFLDINRNSTSVYISNSFAVKHIHIKSISYVRNGSVVTGRYGVLVSDLVNNQPLGVFYDDSTYSTSGYADVSLEFRTPTIINGNYTFFMLDSEGNAKVPLSAGDDIIIIMEFDSGEV